MAAPGVRFLPNAITVLAVSSGLSTIALALQTTLPHHWSYAMGAIALAAILDALDGPTARLLQSQSRIGAELDSLSDAISFGVAPAVLLYVWGLQGHTLGWVACLVYAVCTVLRLARFNSLLDTVPKPWEKNFFTGVPSPAGGLLAVMPLLAGLRFGDGWWTHPAFVGGWLIAMGILMISRLPTIALKSVRLPAAVAAPLLALFVAAVAALFYEPHLILLLGLGVYLLHIPYAGWRYHYLRRHPELWDSAQLRKAVRPRRNRLRMPRRPRVAGRAPDGSPLPKQRRNGSLRSPRRRRQRK